MQTGIEVGIKINDLDLDLYSDFLIEFNNTELVTSLIEESFMEFGYISCEHVIETQYDTQ